MHAVLGASAFVVTVLVKHEHVEPLGLLGYWPYEFDFLMRKHAVEPLISDAAEAIQGDFRLTLAHENRVDGNIVHL